LQILPHLMSTSMNKTGEKCRRQEAIPALKNGAQGMGE
jgi:hypothetical protein